MLNYFITGTDLYRIENIRNLLLSVRYLLSYCLDPNADVMARQTCHYIIVHCLLNYRIYIPSYIKLYEINILPWLFKVVYLWIWCYVSCIDTETTPKWHGLLVFQGESPSCHLISTACRKIACPHAHYIPHVNSKLCQNKSYKMSRLCPDL